LIVDKNLRFEIKVESGFKSVKLQFAGREEPGRGGGSGLDPGDNHSLACRLLGLRLGLGAEPGLVTGKVTSEDTSLVGGIEGVDEGVDAGAVSAVGDQAGAQGVQGASGVLGFELSAVLVESKVTVGRVVGVDEGVPVGIFFDLFVVVIPDNGNGLRSGPNLLLDNGGSGGLGGGVGDFGVERGGSGSGSSDMVSLKDSETILASGVFDSEYLAIFADIRILSDPVTVSVGLFTENLTVLGSESGTGSSVSGVESLFFQDFGIFGVNILAKAQTGHTGNNNHTKHVSFFV